MTTGTLCYALAQTAFSTQTLRQAGAGLFELLESAVYSLRYTEYTDVAQAAFLQAVLSTFNLDITYEPQFVGELVHAACTLGVI